MTSAENVRELCSTNIFEYAISGFVLSIVHFYSNIIVLKDCTISQIRTST